MNYAALRYVIEQTPVEGAAWQVLVVIAYRADRTTGECTANQRTLAHEARIARSSVQLALTQLLDRGILEVVLDGSGRRAACYRIIGHLNDRSSVHNQPVDNPVVDRQVTGSGPIVNLVVDRSAGPSIGRRENRREDLEGQPAAASSAPTDLPAAAVGRRFGANGRVPPTVAAELANLRATTAAKRIAAQQAEQARLQRLYGPPVSEPERQSRDPPARAATG